MMENMAQFEKNLKQVEQNKPRASIRQVNFRRGSNASSFHYTPRRLSKFITISSSIPQPASIKRSGDGTENKQIMEVVCEEERTEEELCELRKIRVLERLSKWKEERD